MFTEERRNTQHNDTQHNNTRDNGTAQQYKNAILRIKELDVLMLGIVMLTVIRAECRNGRAHFKKFKQLFKYKHLLLLIEIWWSKF
jgi:hypothetical protein